MPGKTVAMAMLMVVVVVLLLLLLGMGAFDFFNCGEIHGAGVRR